MQFNYDAFKTGMAIPNKKTMEQELMEKAKLLTIQSQLRNQELSDFEKQFNLWDRKPEAFQDFMGIKNMISPYQQAMLEIQRGQLGVSAARANADNAPTPQKLYDYLKIKFPNMSEEERLSRSGLKYTPPPLSPEEQLKAMTEALK